MTNCSPNCPTQNHKTWGECQRAKNLHLAPPQHSPQYQAQAKHWTEIKEYREARKQGIQPKSTQLKDIRAAVQTSQRLDQPVQDLG